MVDELDLRLVKAYGNEGVFTEKLKEGYTDVSFGYGRESKHIGNTKTRIAKIFVFTGRGSEISTHQQTKSYVGSDPFSYHNPPFDKKYSEKQFEEYKQENEIVLEGKMDLETVVKRLEGIEVKW